MAAGFAEPTESGALRIVATSPLQHRRRYTQRQVTDARAELVLRFLEERGSASRSEIDALLAPALAGLKAAQRRARVSTVLRKLHRRGCIVNEGTTQQPRWMLAPGAEIEE